MWWKPDENIRKHTWNWTRSNSCFNGRSDGLPNDEQPIGRPLWLWLWMKPRLRWRWKRKQRCLSPQNILPKKRGFWHTFFEAQLSRLGGVVFCVFFGVFFLVRKVRFRCFCRICFNHFSACCFFLEVYGLLFLGNLDFFRILAWSKKRFPPHFDRITQCHVPQNTGKPVCPVSCFFVDASHTRLRPLLKLMLLPKWRRKQRFVSIWGSDYCGSVMDGVWWRSFW